jgi:hypothetical protein
VLVADFVPHAHLASDDIDAVDARLEIVHKAPMLEVKICKKAVVLTESFVEIGEVVVRQNNLIFAA